MTVAVSVPMSPRQQSTCRRSCPPPMSPPPHRRRAQEWQLETPPNLAIKVSTPRRPLGSASAIEHGYRANSVAEVECAVADDPALAIVDCRLTGEPPLLRALSHACSPGVLVALLRAGAAVDAVGRGSQVTPLAFVAQPAFPTVPEYNAWVAEAAALIGLKLLGPDPLDRLAGRLEREWGFDEAHCCEHAECLLAFGADRGKRDACGCTAADRAEARGWHLFASLVRHWDGVGAKALVNLWLRGVQAAERGRTRAATTGSPGLQELPGTVCRLVVDMLAPGLYRWRGAP